jgi:hypothetical protein
MIADFYQAPSLENGTALGELRGLVQITCLDQAVAAHEIFLGIGPIGDTGGIAHLAACRLQRVSPILQVAALGQLLHPGHPLLHVLLYLLGGLGRPTATAAVHV